MTAIDPAAFGEGSTDYTAYLACMNSAERQQLRAAYDAAREEWETLDNFLLQGGMTENGPALLPGYTSILQMQDARRAAEERWRAAYLELQRTEAACNQILPYVKTAQQLADESAALLAAGGGIVPSDRPLSLPPPTISGPIAPAPTTTGISGPTTVNTPTLTGITPSTPGLTPSVTAAPTATVTPSLATGPLPKPTSEVKASTFSNTQLMFLAVALLIVAAIIYKARK